MRPPPLPGRPADCRYLNAGTTGVPKTWGRVPLVVGMIRNWHWRILGTVSVGLGVAGILLPLLPTTPFLLLAAWCYSRGSPQLHAWLLQLPCFGRHLSRYLHHRAMTPAAKAVSLVFLWSSLGLSALTWVDGLPFRLILLAVGVGVTVHILLLNASFQ